MCLESEAQRSKQSQVRPEQQTHTCAHTQKKMRTPCRASEAAACLIKAAWHPYPSLTSRCIARGPRSQPQALSEKLSDLGTQTSLCPCTPSNLTQQHLEAGRSVETLWPIRRLHRHQQLTPSTARTVLLSHLPKGKKYKKKQGRETGKGR